MTKELHFSNEVYGTASALRQRLVAAGIRGVRERQPCFLGRPAAPVDAAARTMGHVEGRDGRRCILWPHLRIRLKSRTTVCAGMKAFGILMSEGDPGWCLEPIYNRPDPF